MKKILLIFCGAILLSACHLPSPPEPPDPDEMLIAEGRKIFFNETFDGNGRTCGTCHPAENNFVIDPAFIATRPDNDPLFVAEFNPDLKENFENPRLMREFGLIVENLDGFGDLANVFTLRGVPHTLGLRFSIDSALGPRTGWSGDGAPGDGSLRAFATGAVIQHFTKTTNRIPGVDFRLPTEEELDALEAFQFSLGRQSELTLPLPLKGTVAKRGQEIFNDPTLGKCFACHFNAGANGAPNIFGPNAGNLNFNTGVEDLPDQPQDLTGELVPADDGFGTPGDGTFNTPSLVESADTGPFFHNNSIETIEGAVAFYNGDAFNNSPAGQLIQGATGSGINLDGTQVVEVAAFLRVINALENIRQSIELLEKFAAKNFQTVKEGEELLDLAIAESEDSIGVLKGGGLHPEAVQLLKESKKLIKKAKRRLFSRGRYAREAIEKQEDARNELVETTES
jgi:mono/diheme cytochrome c family protein